MFQYTYKRPGDEKEYVVVWDYNVGLVRMTPFFKSCKFTKVSRAVYIERPFPDQTQTVPAKALNQNPGMKDISYSITGGALVCQGKFAFCSATREDSLTHSGYWMPYQAARAIAATFCYDIRWALTPVFGYDFPSMCLSPKDFGYAKFKIDQAIVQQCTAETDRFRREGVSYRIQVPHLLSPMETPKMRFASPKWKPKAMKLRNAQPANINNSSRPTTRSGYSPQSEMNDDFAFSTHMSPRWNHINRPRTPNSMSPTVSPRTHFSTLNNSVPATPIMSPFPAMSPPPSKTRALPSLQIPTPMPYEEIAEPFRTKRTYSKVAFRDTEMHEQEENNVARPQTAGAALRIEHDIEAAELLLSLAGGGSALNPPTKRTRRGSTM